MNPSASPTAGDHNRGPELVAVTWALTALATFAVALRMFTRIRILKDMALDDFYVMLSLVSMPMQVQRCFSHKRIH